MKRWPWYVAVFARVSAAVHRRDESGPGAAGDVVPVVAAGISPRRRCWSSSCGRSSATGLPPDSVPPGSSCFSISTGRSMRGGSTGCATASSSARRQRPGTTRTRSSCIPLAWVLFALGRHRPHPARMRRSIPLALTGALELRRRAARGFVVVQGIANRCARSGARCACGHRREDRGRRRAPSATRTSTSSCWTATRGPTCSQQYYGFDNWPFLDRPARARLPGERREPIEFLLDLPVGRVVAQPRLHPGAARSARSIPHSRDRTELYRLLRDNRAAHFLRERGYRYVHLQSTWGGTGSNPYADEFLPCQRGCSATSTCARWPMRPGCARSSRRPAWTSRAATCGTSRRLPAQARAPGPKFVFAHFVPPHHPYLFDRDGNVLRKRDDLGPVRVPETAVGGPRGRTSSSSSTSTGASARSSTG